MSAEIPMDPKDPDELLREVETTMPTEAFERMASMVNSQLQSIEALTSIYVHDPSEKHYDTLSEILPIHYDAVKEALRELDKRYEDKDESLHYLLEYCLGLGKQRSIFLNQYDFVKVEYGAKLEKDAEDLRNNLSGMVGDAVEFANSFYHTAMTTDMESFTDDAIKAYNEMPSTVRKKQLQTAGRHALDLVKMTVAVVGGIAIAKRTKIL